jgi:hypothetical protein
MTQPTPRQSSPRRIRPVADEAATARALPNPSVLSVLSVVVLSIRAHSCPPVPNAFGIRGYFPKRTRRAGTPSGRREARKGERAGLPRRSPWHAEVFRRRLARRREIASQSAGRIFTRLYGPFPFSSLRYLRCLLFKNSQVDPPGIPLALATAL